MTTNIDSNGEWSAAIGKAFIAFGSIEHISIIYLKKATSVSHNVIDAATFSKRINLILKHLKKNADQSAIEFSKQLEEVKLLSKKRNLIAHNPLLLEIFEFPDGTIHNRTFIASSRKPSDRIDLRELKELSERVYSISMEVCNCCIKLLA